MFINISQRHPCLKYYIYEMTGCATGSLKNVTAPGCMNTLCTESNSYTSTRLLCKGLFSGPVTLPIHLFQLFTREFPGRHFFSPGSYLVGVGQACEPRVTVTKAPTKSRITRGVLARFFSPTPSFAGRSSHSWPLRGGTRTRYSVPRIVRSGRFSVGGRLLACSLDTTKT